MNDEQNDRIDFSVNLENLYREESFTDLQAGAVRRLVPVHADGSPDSSRTPMFIGTAQILTPEGALPIQAPLRANNLKEAFEAFPYSMQAGLQQMISELKEIQKQAPEKEKDDSRIVLPGRDF
jgi:hypothetical protein